LTADEIYFETYVRSSEISFAAKFIPGEDDNKDPNEMTPKSFLKCSKKSGSE